MRCTAVYLTALFLAACAPTDSQSPHSATSTPSTVTSTASTATSTSSADLPSLEALASVKPVANTLTPEVKHEKPVKTEPKDPPEPPPDPQLVPSLETKVQAPETWKPTISPKGEFAYPPRVFEVVYPGKDVRVAIPYRISPDGTTCTFEVGNAKITYTFLEGGIIGKIMYQETHGAGFFQVPIHNETLHADTYDPKELIYFLAPPNHQVRVDVEEHEQIGKITPEGATKGDSLLLAQVEKGAPDTLRRAREAWSGTRAEASKQAPFRDERYAAFQAHLRYLHAQMTGQ